MYPYIMDRKMSGTNMGLDNISRGLEIGIERMEIVNEMAKLLTFADTKEDFQYILERMYTEREEGITEIDQMLSQNKEGTLWKFEDGTYLLNYSNSMQRQSLQQKEAAKGIITSSMKCAKVYTTKL